MDSLIEMIQIPSGTFLMGSPEAERRYDDEGPQHEVTVPAFLMGRYPVTQAQWRQVAAREDLQVNQPLDPNPSHFKGDDHPVEQVSWQDAVEFCERLSRLTQRTYRLPTEAEWEYACRAGTDTPFHFGETVTTDLASYCQKKTTPVGSFKAANAWGLLDMHGNVWEWCQDDWHDSYDGAPKDGSAWLDENSSTSLKVAKGGSWDSPPWDCRSACRCWDSSDLRLVYLGFRVACDC